MMKFNYFYGNQAEQYQFLAIPKLMLFDEKFSSLSLTAKLLYGLLLDRIGLSRKNKWFDEQNRVYIIYAIAEIQESLGLSKRKAMDSLGELERFGLVEKKRRGFGLPSYLYVKHFYDNQDVENRSAESVTTELVCSVADSTPEVSPENTSEVSLEAP